MASSDGRTNHDSQPGRDGLREGRGVRDVLPLSEVEHAREWLALVSDEPVRVVLEHEQLALAGELCKPAAPIERERPAARVLERRDRVEEGEIPLRQLVGEKTLLVHRHRDDFGAEPREDLERPVVGRRLDEDALAAGELLGEEHETLERPARDDDTSRLDAVPLGEPLAQRAVAAAGAVAEDRAAVALERSPGALREFLDGEALRRGDAAGERDHASRLATSPARSSSTFATPTVCPFAS